MAAMVQVAAIAAQMQAKAVAEQKDKDTNVIPVQRDWLVDLNKKNNNGIHTCLRCKNSFKGKRRRKHCFACQPLVDEKRAAEEKERRDYPYGRHHY